MTGEAKLVWEREAGESGPAFHAFCHYRNQEAHARSLRDAYRQHWSNCLRAVPDHGGIEVGPPPRQHPNAWKRWSIANRWVERVAAYDEYLDAERRRIAEDEILDMAKAHAREAQLARAAIVTGARYFIQRLQSDPAFAEEFKKLSPRQYLKALGVLRLLPAVQQAERTARGLETATIRVATDQVDRPSLSDLVAGDPTAEDMLAELMQQLTFGGSQAESPSSGESRTPVRQRTAGGGDSE